MRLVGVAAVLLLFTSACSDDGPDSYEPIIEVVPEAGTDAGELVDDLRDLDGVIGAEVVDAGAAFSEADLADWDLDHWEVVEVRLDPDVDAPPTVDAARDLPGVESVVGPLPGPLGEFAEFQRWLADHCAGAPADVDLYFELDVTKAQLDNALSALESDPAVTDVDHADEQESYDLARGLFAKNPEAIAGMGVGDFPQSIEFTIEDRDGVDQYEALAGVQKAIVHEACGDSISELVAAARLRD